MKKILMKSEQAQSRAQVADFLRDLATKIESNSVVLKQGKDTVELDIPDQVELEIEVEQKKKAGKPTKMELEIEIEWYKGKTENVTLA